MDNYMLKEMNQTADVVKKLVKNTTEFSFELFKNNNFNKVYFIGCGSSYIAGITASYCFHKLMNENSTPASSFDFLYYRLSNVDENSLIFAFSQSGETHETVKAAKGAKQKGASIVAITNNKDSRLAQLADELVLLYAGEEYGPGTKTVVAQTLGIYIYLLKYAEYQQRLTDAELTTLWDELANSGQLVEELQSNAQNEDLIGKLSGYRNIFILGEGAYSSLAVQASNIFKETTKIHTEGFEIIEFRHGPLEMVNHNTAIITLSLMESPLRREFEKICSIARDAGSFWVDIISTEKTDITNSEADYVFRLPSGNELLGSIIGLTIFHQWAYYIARERGYNPNEFQNIVKTWKE
jgi:glucosamine--fructose-6-phosphate aminotransferase (isomerizing)